MTLTGRRIHRSARCALFASTLVLSQAAHASSLVSRPTSVQQYVWRSGTAAAQGTIVADSFWSQALGIRKHLRLWLPPSYAAEPMRRFPVAYYLHGAWGSEADWSTLGGLPATFDSLTIAGMPEMIVVMPDGDDGWYTTWNFLGDWPGCRRKPPRAGESPERYCVPWPHYDDYIARDLVSYIDRTYRTRADRVHRGIAGLSMGGYGAVSLSLSYPDVFAAAFSHSGVVAPLLGEGTSGEGDYAQNIEDLRGRYSPALWALMKPAFGKDIAAWAARDPVRLLRALLDRHVAGAPAIALDCGKDDRFVAQNRYFVRAAAQAGFPVTYTEWPGAHTWEYWRAHLAESARWLASHIGTD